MQLNQEAARDAVRLRAEGFAMLAELAADMEAKRAPMPHAHHSAEGEADASVWAAFNEGLGREQG